MNILGIYKADNPDDIYFYRPSLRTINTTDKFEIKRDGENLRVKNENVNCLFGNLTFEDFDRLYNDFFKNLNLDFDPVKVDNKSYFLTEKEKEKLTDKIITSWIYYYTINNLTVKVKRSDFAHPYIVDYVLSLLDKKCGVDTFGALTLSAKILRQEETEYKTTVKGRRQYIDR